MVEKFSNKDANRSLMQTAAVLPALGIGDALLMMIASEQLKKKGFQVTTFHDAFVELAPWFPGHNLRPLPSLEKLSSFDLVVAENDNSLKIKQLLAIHRDRLSIFYPTYSPQKHAPLSSQDLVFNSNLSMADNVADAIASLINLPISCKDNGIHAPSDLIHRAKNQQVILHPTSRETSKNWKATGFLSLARKLKLKGYTPLFCVGPKELNAWKFVENHGFGLAEAPTLSALAALIYESGYVIGNDSLIGHLASNLNVPTVIIANDKKRMLLWRPGWLKGQLVLTPSYVPNWKFLRLKEKKWQHFISANKVLKVFDKLTSTL
jgi:ADP-heptose:LPS heptosyltransferase